MKGPISNKMLEVLGDYFVAANLVNKGWTFEEFVNEWQLCTIVMGRVRMNATEAMAEYKRKGDRVDEVLFHIVTAELGRLREVIDQKNFSINLIGEQKMDLFDENKRLREALAFYADETNYEGEVAEYQADGTFSEEELAILNDYGSIANKALQGGIT